MIERPRVVLGLPHYGDVSAGAMARFIQHETHSIESVTGVRSQTSCTPRAFNECLIHGLNLRDEGKATHFAMIHSDVEPLYPNWLDVLYDRMRAFRLDLIAAVIPIKDPQPWRTSTAIGKIDQPWHPDRFIRIDDRAKYPETIFPDDVCSEGEELLVNTGLWLADLRAKFWDTFPGFEFKNRITRDSDGTRIEQFRPEDWELSRHLRRCGARYAATWAVPVKHYGHGEWSSH